MKLEAFFIASFCILPPSFAASPGTTAEWKRHGLLAVTLNFQGGSPERYSKTLPWVKGAFTEDGSLRAEFADRMKRELDAADEQGMVVILGVFLHWLEIELFGWNIVPSVLTP